VELRMGNAVSDFYDEFAEHQLRDVRYPNPRLRAIRRRLRPLLAQRRPKTALDIGCGIGVTTAWIARTVPRVTGVDIAPRQIEIAAALFERPEFHVCELPRDVPPGGPFDLVTLLDVMEHFERDLRADVIRRIGDVITEDAVIAVNIPSRLYALEVDADDRQIIDESVDVSEIVALTASLGMEPLLVDRYGIDSPNQYVFCAFSRTYEIRRPSPGSELGARAKVDDLVETIALRVRARKGIGRDRA
jgi:SAM-dependent methyltransferase